MKEDRQYDAARELGMSMHPANPAAHRTRWRTLRRKTLGGAFGNAPRQMQDEMQDDLIRHPAVRHANKTMKPSKVSR